MTIPNDQTLHQTRLRYVRDRCRCVACCDFKNPTNTHSELKWPLRFLTKWVSMDVLNDEYGMDRVLDWKTSGMLDYEADEVATHFAQWAGSVWPGWLEAGLNDYKTIEVDT